MKRRFSGIIIVLFSVIAYCSAQDQTIIDGFTVKIDHAENDTTRIMLYLKLGNYLQNYDLSKGLKYVEEARLIAEDGSYKYWIAKCDLQEGTVNLLMGNYKESLEKFHLSLQYFEPRGDEHPKSLLGIYNNTGNVYDRLQNYDKALELYFKALNVYLENNAFFDELMEKSLEATIQNNIANIYETKNENEKAIQYYNKALESASRMNDFYNMGAVHNNLGKIKHFKLGLEEEAISHWKKSVKYREQINDLNGLSRNYYFLSEYFIDKNMLDSAEISARESLVLAQKIGSVESQMLAWKFLSDIYEMQNRNKDALVAHKSYKVLSDSLLNIVKVRELSNLEKYHEIQNIEQNEKLARQKLRLRFIGIISVLALLILMGAYFFVVQRFKKKKLNLEKQKLENDIESKNKELAVNVMYLVRKNELINSMVKRLLELKKKALPENQQSIQDIIFGFQTEVDKEIWQEFEYRFQDVYNDFYNNLREKHPDLSPAEERLCAFLRLNMSTKEIAAITHQNAKSIEVARTRLRKKLELTNTDENLITYLSEL